MRYLMLFVLAMAVACSGEKPADDGAQDEVKAPAKEIPADAVTFKLAVTGMDCEGCVKHVTETLEMVDGVADVEIDLKSGIATCVVDKNVKPDALIKAVDGQYKATLKP